MSSWIISQEGVLENFDQMEHIQKILIIEKLKSLNQFERNLLGLYFFEKLSYSEIASLMGISDNFVKSKLQEIQKKLLEEVMP